MRTRHDFVKELIKEVPELHSLLTQHLSENDELFPHVFFGDLTRLIIDLHRKAQKENRGSDDSKFLLRKILHKLEEGMGSNDEEVQELIATSFLENLYPYDDSYESLKSLFGPSLLRELKNFERLWKKRSPF